MIWSSLALPRWHPGEARPLTIQRGNGNQEENKKLRTDKDDQIKKFKKKSDDDFT